MGLPIGTVTVATAGVRVQVVSSGHAVSAVSFRARASNAGPVYVGDDTVAAGGGFEISPGDELDLRFREVVDLRRFYVDAASNGDRVDYAGVAA
ncbi:MAG: hypothetical protein V3S18_08255 [Dehalococcoidia bacterium]